ncbi:hypothetical protein chiPu_0015042 [Chiloscyllium punctatum]|uniref:C-type lectin domain-containing protein n=1 Tax=Chiloscyllium punctatum TaxID=137246 RepID=A0A401T1Q7_CHIPU|nr:hypothetical protein [Chiloscyllium punctatum]
MWLYNGREPGVGQSGCRKQGRKLHAGTRESSCLPTVGNGGTGVDSRAHDNNVRLCRNRPLRHGINCPGNRDWYMRNDHCYLWKPSLTATWEGALNICRAYRGTDLVYLDSIDEKDWLTTQVTEVFWTGLNDRATESVFQWTTNSSLDADLEPFLKNDLMNGDSKDCIEMDVNTGQLMDRSCSEIKTFVCKSKKCKCFERILTGIFGWWLYETVANRQ